MKRRKDGNARAEGRRIYPCTLALCFSALMIVAPASPPVAVMGAVLAGALFVFRSPLVAALAAAAAPVALWLPLLPPLPSLPPLSPLPPSPGFWSATALMACAALIPHRAIYFLMHLSQRITILCLALSTACLCVALLLPMERAAALLIVPANLFAALLGAILTRYLAFANARILGWDAQGLEAIVRNLLLGRITSGMLHDLAQPLNVISMANGNLSYIIEHIGIDPDKRAQIDERIRRISANTENAAAILSLFRWFGRGGNADYSLLNVRSALERAIAATRSNVRHADISVELAGDGLDHPLSRRHGTVEIMGVAALLCAFGGFLREDGSRIKGQVLLRADRSPAHILVTLHCMDEEGMATIDCHMDPATLWLIQQIALECDSEFHHRRRRGQTTRFTMRIARDDI
ncbi:signal transduction histidine kinase [Sphingobium jiangsuense]|uniref:Signal transduction histidine kinase n=2 Tax=Sphingobium jiangsuense TaxID=870476 RepID=A0A7W6BHK0_9SPHN|nr:hypothetical protein [Sphingobium jiangsuense]MBB3927033.1 signal transduction histidine kinase [Sphingobium jiangsuense]